MHTKSKLLVALGTAALAVCPALNAQAPANTLVAAKAASAPTLDGNASDPAWAAAQPLTFKVFGGANFGGTGETTVTLKAVTSGDVHVAYRWDNGRWTYEVARKLATGSKYDVQFDDPNRTYYFGFAAFDNAQVRHAMGGDALKLVFAK